VWEITATLAEIDEIIGEQDFKSVVQVVGSTRQALADIEACGDEVTARHFDLLHVHGGSIGVVLKESDESAGTLVSALEKAVAAVKGAERAAEATAKPEAAGEVPGAARPRPSVQSSAPDTAAEKAPEPPAKIPFMVRVKAWWEGVDPSDMAAGASK
jgi:hypothetical protein